VALLKHKEALALERLFRLLGLLHPNEDVRSIYRGLRNRRSQVRASSRDLVGPPLRDTLLTLVDEVSDAEKLARLGHPSPETAAYESLLESLFQQRGVSMRCLVAYHAGELRLTKLRGTLEKLSSNEVGLVRTAVGRALELLSGPEREGAANGG
jgi:hypothetical protein